MSLTASDTLGAQRTLVVAFTVHIIINPWKYVFLNTLWDQNFFARLPSGLRQGPLRVRNVMLTQGSPCHPLAGLSQGPLDLRLPNPRQGLGTFGSVGRRPRGPFRASQSSFYNFIFEQSRTTSSSFLSADHVGL